MDRMFDDFFLRNPSGYEGYRIVDIDVVQTDKAEIVEASIRRVTMGDHTGQFIL